MMRVWYKSVGDTKPTVITDESTWRAGETSFLADCLTDPDRYLIHWAGGVIPSLVDDPDYQARAAAVRLELGQSIMRIAIKAKENARNVRKIEHPDIPGAFFDPSDKIQRMLDRYDDIANTDPLPINNGCWDDIDENPVAMTIGKLKHLRNAFVDREEANYQTRKAHIKAMKLLADPMLYDYSGGWA